MIDIHSHLKTDSGKGSVQELLQDMDRFHIDQRVISEICAMMMCRAVIRGLLSW